MNLRPGTKLRSAVCATEVIVVKAPPEPVDLLCGGVPMLASGTSVAGADGRLSPGHASGTQIGKRYADEAAGLEVLCTKPGEGSLSIGAEPLLLKEAKPLPSSD
jgi:hypothetical protein